MLIDEDYRRLHEHPDLQTPEAAPHLLNRDLAFRPVGDKAVPLEYGATYEFRVRLADLTRGGPASTEPVPDPAGHSVTTVPFRRRKAPGRIQILGRPSAADRRVTIAKPRLGYPELLFAGVPFAALEEDLAARAADPDLDGKKARELGAPDPDVLSVEIQVAVRTLDGDAVRKRDGDAERKRDRDDGLFLPLYSTTRQFNGGDDLSIDLAFEDHAVLTGFSPDQPADGPLVLPTARGIRLTFTAIGRETLDYFDSAEARRGEPVPLECRADAMAEEQDTLLVDPDGLPAVRSFYFQSPPADPSIPRPSERLAQEAALDHTGLQLSGRSGHRTVLGCSAGLRHVLSPDSASIQIASGADLVHRWINIVQMRLQRDWTWDGLDEAGISVTRTIQRPAQDDVVEVVGVVRLPHALGTEGACRNPDGPARRGAPVDQPDLHRRLRSQAADGAASPRAAGGTGTAAFSIGDHAPLRTDCPVERAGSVFGPAGGRALAGDDATVAGSANGLGRSRPVALRIGGRLLVHAVATAHAVVRVRRKAPRSG